MLDVISYVSEGSVGRDCGLSDDEDCFESSGGDQTIPSEVNHAICELLYVRFG